jgi:hypothetical protein
MHKIDAMFGAPTATKETNMTISLNAATHSLRRALAHLPAATLTRALKQMEDDGLLDTSDGIHASADKSGGYRFGHLSANEAAEPSDFHATEVAAIVREIHNLGWSGDIPTDKAISVYELDAKLAANRDDDTIVRKIALKTRMAKIGMLL